ncbi:MAG: hypothetical protein H7Y32_21495 [Chloroflexales bacterium]|nr:hypothetical protein [Chloroflexales bacterium]
MSGVGKTFWASRLAAAGFACLHCDDLIAARLRAHFDIGSGSVHDVGNWMGLPYEACYPARAATYLAYETEVLRTIAHEVGQRATPVAKIVIDMTGSAVYVDRAILAAVRQVATIVYLAADPAHHQQMLQAYLARPRPVLWNGAYQPLPNEPQAAALARCYALLLAQREALYAALCHVRLDAAIHTDPAFSVDAFVRAVNASVNANG